MNKTFSILGILIFSTVMLIKCGENQQKEVLEKTTSPIELKILKSWQGDYPVNQLNLLSENQDKQAIGYIYNPKIFMSIWTQFKPTQDVPEIDFKTNLVLFARNTLYYNRISIGKINLNDGVVTVVAIETRSSMPIKDRVAFSLAVVHNQGISAIEIGNNTIIIK